MALYALFADIHANALALEAVLEDIGQRRPLQTFCLGDLVGYGPQPNEVVQRVRDLGFPTVLGNYDDGVAFERGECGCYYGSAQAQAVGEASYAFTVRTLTEANKAWLRSLPRELSVSLEGTALHLVHGSPRRINEYLTRDRDKRTYQRLAAQEQADVLVFGHTHEPWHRRVGPVTFVNVGSVGWPKDGDARATYTLLSLPELQVEVVRVPYPVEKTVRLMLEAGLPPELARAVSEARGLD